MVATAIANEVRCVFEGPPGPGLARVLRSDLIWDAAVEVWKNLPSHKIAQSFVQANRIAKMVIKNGGDNKFLGNGGSISGGVRDDFHPTECGIARKDGKHLNAPN